MPKYTPATKERGMKVRDILVWALAGTTRSLQAADILRGSPRTVRRLRWHMEHDGAHALRHTCPATPAGTGASQPTPQPGTHSTSTNSRPFERPTRGPPPPRPAAAPSGPPCRGSCTRIFRRILVADHLHERRVLLLVDVAQFAGVANHASATRSCGTSCSQIAWKCTTARRWHFITRT